MHITIKLNSRTHITCEGEPKDLAAFVLELQHGDASRKAAELQAEIDRNIRAFKIDGDDD